MSSARLETVVVADSGPLIALAAIDQLGLLRAMHREVLVPAAVWAEVTQRGQDRVGAAAVLAAADWLQRVLVDPPPDEYLRTELGPGEAEAIALAARAERVLLLLDDRDARRVATTVYHLPVRGVVGTLVEARRRELVPAVRPLCLKLVAIGYRLQDALITHACRLVGE